MAWIINNPGFFFGLKIIDFFVKICYNNIDMKEVGEMKRREDLEELSSFKDSVQRYKDTNKKQRLSCFLLWTLGFAFMSFILCFEDVKLLVYPGFIWLMGMILMRNSYRSRTYSEFWAGELTVSRKRETSVPKSGNASGTRRVYLIYEQNVFEENVLHTSKTLYDFFVPGKTYCVICCGEVIIDVFV